MSSICRDDLLALDMGGVNSVCSLMHSLTDSGFAANYFRAR